MHAFVKLHAHTHACAVVVWLATWTPTLAESKWRSPQIINAAWVSTCKCIFERIKDINMHTAYIHHCTCVCPAPAGPPISHLQRRVQNSLKLQKCSVLHVNLFGDMAVRKDWSHLNLSSNKIDNSIVENGTVTNIAFISGHPEKINGFQKQHAMYMISIEAPQILASYASSSWWSCTYFCRSMHQAWSYPSGKRGSSSPETLWS